MKNKIIIGLIIIIASFAMLGALGMAYMPHNMTDCPIVNAECTDLNSMATMLLHHISIINIFGQGTFMELMNLFAISLLFILFSFFILEVRQNISYIKIYSLEIPVSTFNRLIRWIAIKKRNIPLVVLAHNFDLS